MRFPVLASAVLVALGLRAAAETASGAAPPPAAPLALALPDLDGKMVTLGEYRGVGPVLVVNYRGHWCPGCVEQLLQLEALKPKELRGVAVLAVSADPPERTRELVARLQATRGVKLTHRFLSAPPVPTLHRTRGSVPPATIGAPPSWILVDRDGHEVWRFVETEHHMRPSAREVRAGLARLGPPRVE